MLQMEHYMTDVLQFSFMENSLNTAESDLVSQLGILESPSVYHKADTASHDKKGFDPSLDFFAMESTDYQFLEPFLSDDCNDMPPFALHLSPDILPCTSTDELSTSFNQWEALETIHDTNEVPDTIETSCKTSMCCGINNLCDKESPSKLPSIAETNVDLHIESEERNSSDDNQLQNNESAAANKYLEMRRKNNIASRRSRKIRKTKNAEAAVKLKELERQNRELLLIAEKLQKQRDSLKCYLMKVIAEKK